MSLLRFFPQLLIREKQEGIREQAHSDSLPKKELKKRTKLIQPIPMEALWQEWERPSRNEEDQGWASTMKSIPYPVTSLGVFPAQGTKMTEEYRKNSSQKSE